MTVTSSGIFLATMVDLLRSASDVDLGAETHRVALFGEDITPDFTAAAADARYGAGAFATGEIVGTGYTAGGVPLLNTALTNNLLDLLWTADDPEWANSTLVEVRCALVYADAVTTPFADPAIVLVDFGDTYSTNNGTFAIDWDDAILAFPLVPDP